MTRREREVLYAELFKTCGREGFVTAARRLCRTDLYFLLTVILGRKDMQRDWLFDRCMEVQDSPDGHLDLWAREHYKSSIITFGKTIQDILADPEITVGLFSFTRPIAKAFLRQIMREFEGNDTLKELFPDILWEQPRKEAPKWSEDDGIIVRRAGNPKEATIEAWGLVDGQPTSKHYGLVVRRRGHPRIRDLPGHDRQGHRSLGALAVAGQRRRPGADHRHPLPLERHLPDHDPARLGHPAHPPGHQ